MYQYVHFYKKLEVDFFLGGDPGDPLVFARVFQVTLVVTQW